MSCPGIQSWSRIRLIATTIAVCAVGNWGCGKTDEKPADQGAFVILTYNVAGLPQELSSSDPERNIPMISPMLNEYDLVLVQEDFWYHELLDADVRLPFRSEPMYEIPDLFQMGDGLNRFSSLVFLGHERVTWEVCHGTTSSGSDCLTEKGFSVAATRLTDDLWVDVYNLHMDASSGEEDLAARDAQVAQLLAYLRIRSAGRAVIVAGDTNMDRDDPEELAQLEVLLAGGGFADACEVLGCGEDHKDRVLYRSSEAVTLEPVEWTTPDEFVDGEGQDLSDHKPVAVRFVWNRVPRD